MRVFVAGGTGAIGRRLVPRLVGAGHQVTASTRNASKTDLLRRLGAEPAVADGLDAATMGEAVARAAPEVVIHQMTALAGPPDMKRFDKWFAATNALRTRGTKILLSAAGAAGARRFVAQSYGGWTSARSGGPVTTEDDPFDPDPPRTQRSTLEAIRFLERAVLDAPLDGIVLRYGSLYGPGASEGLVELVRKRRLPVIGDGGGVWSWIHVDDAAGATIMALERARPGVYNVVDDEPARVAEWLPYLASTVGARKPLRVPVWLGRLLAGDAGVSMMTQIRGCSNAKANRELGWQPTWASWRNGFRRALTDVSES